MDSPFFSDDIVLLFSNPQAEKKESRKIKNKVNVFFIGYPLFSSA